MAGSIEHGWLLEIEVDGHLLGHGVLVASDIAITCAPLYDSDDPHRTFAVRAVNGERRPARWVPEEKRGRARAGLISIQLSNPFPPEVQPARLSSRIEIGQRVRLHGTRALTDGRIVGRGGPGDQWLRLEGIRSTPASIGGGITNTAGDVIGLLVEPTWVIPIAVAYGSEAVEQPPQEAAIAVAAHPGIAADTIDGVDLLGRTGDAEAMAALLAATSTSPPLSVGLFGDWGSGKSFFMRMLRSEIDALASLSRLARKQGRPTAICAEIRQIVFNAWHYTDANLWASLVSAIFAGLAEPRAGESASQAQRRWEAERERLATVLESSKVQLADAQSLSAAADADVERLRDELEGLEEKKAQERKSLTGLKPAGQAAWSDRTVQASVRKVREHFGQEVELAQIREFTTAGLSGIRRAARIWQMLKRSQRRCLAWLLLTAVVLGATSFVAIPLVFKESWSTLAQIFGSFVALIAPVAVVGTFVAGKVNQGLGVVEAALAAASQAEQAEHERLETQKQAILAEIAQLDARQTMLRKEMLHAEARVNAAAAEVGKASTGRLLASFVSERSVSKDYQSQLGMIATIRRDFEQLAGLMELAPEGDDAVPPIERIVLYIDDLDRCPPDRVVDVLQAIHLLLGLELFVVVVAVDARWLLSSLDLHFEKVLGAPGGHWSATPMNYLEKIFQIPYNLSAMDGPAYAQLVGSLLEEAATRGSYGSGKVLREELSAIPAEETVAIEMESAGVTLSFSRLNPAGMSLTDEEKEFAQKLAPLIRTPRAAKRLTNLYRLIRAGLEEDVLAGVLETGEFEAILFLLAVLVGDPEEAPKFFATVVQMSDDETWIGLPGLAEVQPHIRQLKPWVPVVARYSFHLNNN
jgi:hypothetical protein